MKSDEQKEREAKQREKLVQMIGQAINSVSRENASSTPDFILAEMLVQHLETYEDAINGARAWSDVPSHVRRDVSRRLDMKHTREAGL